MLHVLVVEDERKVARFIQKGLTAEGIDTTIAESGEQALGIVQDHAFDVLTVDISLPGIDGIEFIRSLRDGSNGTPVLVLSARSTLQDKLRGFDGGADDYLAKPFAFEELVARIQSLARRNRNIHSETRLSYADIEMDIRKRQVYRSGKAIELTTQEFNLLELFMEHPEEVISRAKILERVWREQFDRETNVIEVYMMYLRKKLAVSSDSAPILQTVRGAGYRLREGKDTE